MGKTRWQPTMIQPFKIDRFFYSYNGPVIEPWLNNQTIDLRTISESLNTGLVWYSDVHCIGLLGLIPEQGKTTLNIFFGF
jgi:hypothetical protein